MNQLQPSRLPMRILYSVFFLFTTIASIHAQLNCNNARLMTCPFDDSFGTFNEANNVSKYCNDRNQGFTGDEVVYSFTPISSSVYTFSLTNISPGDDLDIFILSSCNEDSCLADSDGSSSTAPDNIVVTLNAGQQYYVVVDTDESAGGNESNYRLQVSGCQASGCPNGSCVDWEETLSCFNPVRNASIDSQDTNDFNAECQYGPSSCYSGNSDFNGADEVIQIDFGSNPSNFSLALTELTGDLDMFLYQSCNGTLTNCVGSSLNPNTTDESIVLSNVSGIYYLVIDGFRADITSPYQLELIGCRPQNCPRIRGINCGDELCCLTTSGAGNNFSVLNTNYASCRAGLTNQAFDGGDVIIAFNKTVQDESVTIELSHATSINLSMFIIEDYCGLAFIGECVGSGINFPNNSLPEGELWTDNGSLSPGTYYVIIDGSSPLQDGDFSLSLVCKDVCPQGDCNNWASPTITCTDNIRNGSITSHGMNDFNTECQYAPTNCYVGNSSFNGNDEVHRIDVGPDPTNIRLELSGLSTDLDIFLYDNCVNSELANCVGNSLNSGTQRDEIIVQNASGVYYVVVDASESFSYSDYTLTLTCEGEPPNCQDARLLTCNTRISNESTVGESNNFYDLNTNYAECRPGSAGRSFSGSDMIYRFTKTNAEDILTVRMDHSSSVNLSMFILDICSGDVVNCTGAGTNFPNNSTPVGEEWTDNGQLPIGTYYVVVDGSSSQVAGSFSIMLNCETPCPNGNCTQSVATLSCSNPIRNGAINELDGNDFTTNCHYRPTTCFSGTALNEGPDEVILIDAGSIPQTIELTLSGMSQNIDMFLFKRCVSGAIEQCVARSQNSGFTATDQIVLQNASGVFYLIIDGTLPATETNYKLELSCASGGTACQDISGELDCDSAIALMGGPYVVEGCDNRLENISQTDATQYCNGTYTDFCADEIIYTFDAVGGVNYRFSIDHGEEQPKMFLLNSCDRNDCISSSSLQSNAQGEAIEFGSCVDKTIYLVVDEEDARDFSACVSVEELGPIDGCGTCNDICCNDSNETLLSLTELENEECNTGLHVAIYECRYNGQCSYAILRTSVENPIFTNNYAQTVAETLPSGEIIDCEGRTLFTFDYATSFNTFFADQATDCVLAWTCTGFTSPDFSCTDTTLCIETCCVNSPFLEGIVAERNSNTGDCFDGDIERATFRGQCVTIVVPSFIIADAPTNVFDCSGNLIFSFGGFVPPDIGQEQNALAMELMDRQVIWSCRNKTEYCPSNENTCDDSCCENNQNTLRMLLDYEQVLCLDGQGIAVYECNYNGECSYTILRTSSPVPFGEYNSSTTQFLPSGEIINCEGTTLFTFDYATNFNVFFADLAEDCQLIWTCSGFENVDCEEGNGSPEPTDLCPECCENNGTGFQVLVDRLSASCSPDDNYGVYAVDYLGSCALVILRLNAGSQIDATDYSLLVLEEAPAGELINCDGSTLYTFDYSTGLNIENFANQIRDAALLWTCSGLASDCPLEEPAAASLRSFNETSNDFSVVVYPNPFDDFLQIDIQVEKACDAILNMYTIDGKLIENRKLELLNGLNKIILDDLQLSEAGYYLYQVHTVEGVSTGKILKVN